MAVQSKIDDFLKEAYNNGYLLGRYRNDLADTISKGIEKAFKDNHEAYPSILLHAGLKDGVRIARQEKLKDQSLKDIEELRKELDNPEAFLDLDK